MSMENRALTFASQVTSMRGQLADLSEGDVAILVTAKKGEDERVSCLVSGQPTIWEVIGLLEYTLLIERQMASNFEDCNDGE